MSEGFEIVPKETIILLRGRAFSLSITFFICSAVLPRVTTCSSSVINRPGRFLAWDGEFNPPQSPLKGKILITT
jgi:hypothetical protein